jgi:predicted membrane-bound spermidine synthase
MKFIHYLKSYVKEVPLETIRRSETDALHVSLKQGRLMLSTDFTIYSWDDLYKNFLWGLGMIPFDRFECKRMLVLGLGLGAIPYMMEKVYRQKWEVHAVEIDPEVIRLARKYNFPRIKCQPKVYCEDAFGYLLKNEEKYDVIIVDVCKEDSIPFQFESIPFLESIRSSMSEGGLVLFNRFYSTYKDQFKTDRFFQRQFKEVFPSGIIIDQHGTCLLINDHEKIKKGN